MQFYIITKPRYYLNIFDKSGRDYVSRVSHSGHPSPPAMYPLGVPPPLKSEVPFQEMIPRKKPLKNGKLSLILVFQS